MKTLATRLRKILKDKNLSQQDLASLVGVSQNSISLILRGVTKNPGNIIQIAKALDVDAEWLSTGEVVYSSCSSPSSMLGERLEKLLLEQNLTQHEFAKIIGLSQSSVNKIITGQTRNPRNILEMANALGVDPNWLKTGKRSVSSKQLVVSLPDRLREALNQKNISQEELANNIGITQGTISLILRGVTKNSRHFPAIAKALDVELDWLLYGKGNRNLNDKFSTPMDTEKFLTDIGVALVNSFQSVNVSAGFGSFNDGTTTPDGVMPYSLPFLNSLHVKAKECAVFWAKGDSMLPTINNGDQLLVDLSQNTITGNNIYLIQNKDSVWVKRVRTSWNGIDLISDNREEYPIIHIESTEAEHLKVIGRVVHIGHSLILK